MFDQIGNEGPWQTAQVFPFLSLIYPCSPQVAAHEFLIVHAYSLLPTKKTA
jgi:hypothetical protein